jgi:phospholipase/lecithinase/hemolysin
VDFSFAEKDIARLSVRRRNANSRSKAAEMNAALAQQLSQLGLISRIDVDHRRRIREQPVKCP